MKQNVNLLHKRYVSFAALATLSLFSCSFTMFHRAWWILSLSLTMLFATLFVVYLVLYCINREPYDEI